ncbi:hypothetical protein [Egicoccus sp. AB-alg2]|uniref:hypothetical protein n=1 Tax=Egicoccus sp. AB-alg2 TaxID=3242693 RepID=UPI00359EBFC2
MARGHGRPAAADAGHWSSRLAGTVLILVGALNVAFGLVSFLTELVRLSAGIAGGLVAVGLVTVALGTLVWRGSRPAIIAAFTIFTMLLLFQVSDAFANREPGQAVATDALARFGVLAVLVGTLGVAAWRIRRPRTASVPDAA